MSLCARQLDLNPYRLIAAAEAIITDYSSIVVDAVGYGKQVAIYCPDISSYHRGLNDGVMERIAAVTTKIDDPEHLMQFISGEIAATLPDPLDVAELYSVGTGRVVADLLTALDFFD